MRGLGKYRRLGTQFGNREWSEWIWEFKVPGNPSGKEREKDQGGAGRALALGVPWEACPEQSREEAAGSQKGSSEQESQNE